jgi:hypothetical protein
MKHTDRSMRAMGAIPEIVADIVEALLSTMPPARAVKKKMAAKNPSTPRETSAPCRRARCAGLQSTVVDEPGGETDITTA